MNLTGIDLSGTIRFTQPNDALDMEIDLFKSGQTVITAEFYTLLFFNLMNGVVTGQDDSGNGISTGISFKISDTAGTEVLSTAVAKLDWYEGTKQYYIRAITTGTITPAADVNLATVEIIYTANDVSNSAAMPITIVESNTLAKSKFAVSDANGTGIPVLATNGQLTVTGQYLVTITK